MDQRRFRQVLLTLIKWLSHTIVFGQENIPPTSSFIVAANHMSRFDVPVSFAMIGRDDVTGLAADKYRRYPFFSWFINAGGGIWIDRESADLNALRKAIKHLRNGGVLGIAPEGTRSKVGALLPAKSGIAYLAEKSKSPILPMAISGTEIAMRELLNFRRPHVTIRIGKPFQLPPLNRKDRAASLQSNSDEVMCRIALLLPKKYHGAYTDHPRLVELQAANSTIMT
jgi:1-acyl-sn-glycerol-3-phosphate acyltransferase